jgi:hypothetical protein
MDNRQMKNQMLLCFDSKQIFMPDFYFSFLLYRAKALPMKGSVLL